MIALQGTRIIIGVLFLDLKNDLLLGVDLVSIPWQFLVFIGQDLDAHPDGLLQQFDSRHFLDAHFSFSFLWIFTFIQPRILAQKRFAWLTIEGRMELNKVK